MGADVNSFRILHVDDDPLMRDVVELALGFDAEFVVMSCEGGEQALAAVPGWQPDLIILDVLMPGMDGPALLARLRADPATAKIPVIFITGRAPPAERERLLALGAVAVIAKPFYPVKLAETVRRHLQSIKLAAAGFDFAKRLRRMPRRSRASATSWATAPMPPSCRTNSIPSCTSSRALPACSTSRP